MAPNKRASIWLIGDSLESATSSGHERILHRQIAKQSAKLSRGSLPYGQAVFEPFSQALASPA